MPGGRKGSKPRSSPANRAVRRRRFIVRGGLSEVPPPASRRNSADEAPSMVGVAWDGNLMIPQRYSDRLG
jgi:hypothetical protein